MLRVSASLHRTAPGVRTGPRGFQRRPWIPYAVPALAFSVSRSRLAGNRLRRASGRRSAAALSRAASGRQRFARRAGKVRMAAVSSCAANRSRAFFSSCSAMPAFSLAGSGPAGSPGGRAPTGPRTAGAKAMAARRPRCQGDRATGMPRRRDGARAAARVAARRRAVMTCGPPSRGYQRRSPRSARPFSGPRTPASLRTASRESAPTMRSDPKRQPRRHSCAPPMPNPT